jgi:hypothetical protein
MLNPFSMTKMSSLTAQTFSAVVLFLLVVVRLEGAHLEEKFDVLQTRIGNFTNVTVTTHGRNSIFIMHAGGMATIYITDLSPELQQQLGYSGGPEKTQKKKSSLEIKKMMASFTFPKTVFAKELETKIPKSLFNPTAALILLGSVMAIYFFGCFCLMLICKKTGNEPGVLVWLPLLQIFPMLRAAGMSGAWFLAYLVPGLNLIAQIIWSFKIVQARAKGSFVAVMLLLPVFNILAFLYLAFSAAEKVAVEKEKSRPPGVTLQTA